MDGLEELTAPYTDKEIGGKVYRLGFMNLDDWGEATRILKASRPSPIESIKPHLRELDEESRKHLLSLAWRDERDGDLIAQFEVERWIETPQGRIYRFWFMLRKHQPKITLKQADALLQILAEEDAESLRILAAEALGNPKGNSQSPDSDAQETPSGEATGENCSAT